MKYDINTSAVVCGRSNVSTIGLDSSHDSLTATAKGTQMNQTSYSPGMTKAPPVRALIVQPDTSYEIRVIDQSGSGMEGIVGGTVAPISTEHCTFWYERTDVDRPCNILATYLWWKLDPAMETKGLLEGTVVITGPSTDDMESLPIPHNVVDLFERIAAIHQEEIGKA